MIKNKRLDNNVGYQHCAYKWLYPKSSSSPTPPTEPVTPGYIRGYDHKLGYGFEYPEDWEMHSFRSATGCRRNSMGA